MIDRIIEDSDKRLAVEGHISLETLLDMPADEIVSTMKTEATETLRRKIIEQGINQRKQVNQNDQRRSN